MFEVITKGGWMMLPLLVFSFLAIAVVIDRAWAFRRYGTVDVRSLRAKVLELIHAGSVEQAAVLCAQTPGPVSAVLLSGLKSYHRHRPLTDQSNELIAIMEKSMDDYAQHAVSAVQKRLTVLSTVANAAPLLGMTGTVVGMIGAFEGLANAGSFTPGGEVAQNISVALITTAAGLIIALIAVIPLNYFASKADEVELDIEEATTELLDFVATEVEAKASAAPTTND